MATTEHPTPVPFWQRLFFSVPVIGWIARDVTMGDRDNLWYAIGGGLALWAILVMTFGLPGLYIPALISVPVIWAVLLVISRG
jgi:hypothetical protein